MGSGVEKRAQGEVLLRKLAERFCKNGILHYGQGKWYSGEVLPRWSLNCFWLKSGEPIWKNKSLFAHDASQGIYNEKTAKQFIEELALALNVNKKYILSTNEKNGFVLPLDYAKNWCSEQWKFLEKELVLLAGDSPLGYRLPLAKIIFSKNQQEKIVTALCVEIRQGHLCVFLPPFTELKPYLLLVGHIEQLAEKLNLKIILEGYEPPHDSCLTGFRLTPDPGVLEVNIQPAGSWNELKENLSILYEEAKHIGLGADKFMMDGRQIAAGGGCHITLGGPTLDDSPWLRRPDLLRSLLTYFQHHPSFSYLFSGLFVGPTSQAPRIDEARHEALYELEIALQQIQKNQTQPYWMIDRLLRNVLVDVTGNTHRTEICIDKLYAPGNSAGRQGLVELRAFEMPPTDQLCLLQMLLIRALICHFWDKPYQGNLIRWGTTLHDRFMLPYFIWQDFSDVIAQLNQAGYAFKLEWFLPFFEFRFPHYGNIQIGDIHLELRMALETWNVLGEEVVSSQTSRAVDYALERLQVKVTGLNPERYIITCNNRALPLQPTNKKDELIAGVRFKAWNLPFTLHPHLPTDNPLVFDIYDIWNQCSIGGCTYYIAHPGGRNYTQMPINAEEAEARRLSRFEAHGHTPNMKQPKIETPNSEYPCTLDLRRNA